MSQSRIVISVIVSILIAALVLPTARSLMQKNYHQIVGLMGVARCLDESELLMGAHSLWSRQLTEDDRCFVPVPSHASGEIATLVAWVNGFAADSTEIALIEPVERQEVFAWRNRTQAMPPGYYAASVSTSVAQFIAWLAVQAWKNGSSVQAIRLSDAALAADDPNVAANVLIKGIGVRHKDEYDTYHDIRRSIAQTLPDYKENYLDWFETAVTFQQWDSGLAACNALQKRFSPQSGGIAAVCHARLAYYQGDIVSAYRELKKLGSKLQGDPAVFTWLGISAKQLGKCDEATDAFARAIDTETDPTAFVNLYWQLGDCQLILGKRSEAKKSYAMALDNDRAGRFRDELTSLIESME